MHEVKRQVDVLHPTMRLFAVKPAMRLLTFLSTLRDPFDMISVSEEAAVRVLAYFLDREAKDVLMEQMEEAEEGFESGRTMLVTCPDVCNALLQRFLPDEVLRQSYDSVARAVQMDEEDEASFADRIRNSALLFRHVFTKSEVVNSYIQGLTPAVRESICISVRLMPESDKKSLAVVRQVAVWQGKSHRLMIADAQAVNRKRKGEENQSGPRKLAKPSRTSTFLVPESPEWAKEDVGYKPAIGIKTD